jgi:anthranilate phosphoribosyltransferase
LVSDKVETLREGLELGFAVLDDGRALAALERLVSISQGQG